LERDNSKLLIVDDEPALRKALHTALVASGFEVSEARTGEEALMALKRVPADLVLLDINMPGMSGIEACRRIRGLFPHAGILMVTVRDAEEDKVEALEAGADDFVTKPYRLRELVARLRAVLRRLNSPRDASDTMVRAGFLEIDLERRLVSKRGVEVHLTPTEFDLLAYLVRNQGAPILHSKLLRAVWGPEYGGELEYLRSYVKTIRKKIEDDPSRPEYILTEPWLGYRFRNPSDLESPAPEDD
jgi:two-component system KDP operon response regulator KdpE